MIHPTAVSHSSCPISGVVRFSDGPYAAKALIYALRRLVPNGARIESRLRPVQMEALERWHKRCRKVHTVMLKKCFDLRYVFRIFDDYFLRGLLQKRVQINWVKALPNRGLSGRATWKSNVKGNSRVQIHIKKPTAKYRSEAIVQDVWATLLVNMAHAFFLLYGCHCRSCLGFKEAAARHNIGHDLAEAMFVQMLKDEADLTLNGFEKPWRLHHVQHYGNASTTEASELQNVEARPQHPSCQVK